MAWQCVVMLGAIVVDSTNNRINLTNSGTGVNKTFEIDPGIYYLRPDPAGTDTESIFYGIRTATDIASPFTATPASHVGMTVGSAIAINTDRTLRHCVTSLITSSNTVWRFGVAATTFDPALLGYAASDTASSTTATSTLSPTTVWVANDVASRRLPSYMFNASGETSQNGIYNGKKRGDLQKSITIDFDFQAGQRVNLPENDSTSTLMPLVTFLDKYCDGSPIELWWTTHTSGTTLYNLGNGTLGTHYDRIGDAWHIEATQLEDFTPDWDGNGVDEWFFSLEFLHYEG